MPGIEENALGPRLKAEMKEGMEEEGSPAERRAGGTRVVIVRVRRFERITE